MHTSVIAPPSATARGSRRTAVVVVAALALAGCGGDPGVDAEVTDALAARADRVADLADAGDGCGALEELALLRTDAAAAADAGTLPTAAVGEVDGAADRIAAGLTCAEEGGDEVEDDGEHEDDHEDEDDEKDDEKDEKDDEDKDDKGKGNGKAKGKEKDS